MGLRTDLCVELRVPLTNRKTSFGSGYFLGPKWVLTAHHVLFGGVDDGADIRIGWRGLEPDDERRTRRITRAQIRWWHAELDLAVIEVGDAPFSAPTADQIVARFRPPESCAWEARGFLAGLNNVDGQQRDKNPKGSIKRYDAYTRALNLETDITLDGPELWAGFSGAPVFANGRLTGVAQTAKRGEQGRGLGVTLMAAALDKCGDGENQQTFAEVLGLSDTDEAATFASWFNPEFAARLERAPELDNALRNALRERAPEAELPTTAKDWTHRLISEPPDLRVGLLFDAFNETWRKRVEDDGAAWAVVAFGELAALMLVMVFEDFGVVREVRNLRAEGGGFLAGLSADRLDTEALLAMAEGAPPHLEMCGGQWIGVYDRTAEADRIGIDEDGSRLVADIVKHLDIGFRSGEAVYQEAITSFVDTAAAGSRIAKLATTDDKMKALARHLEDKARLNGRTYYIRVELGESGRQEALAELQRRLGRGLTVVETNPHIPAQLDALIRRLETIQTMAREHAEAMENRHD